jgi:uncharacterized protein YgbK (DUF1537 family)
MADYFLADDLSGALDAAAGFHHAGHNVQIALSADDWRLETDSIVGITTETRNMAAVEAAAAVRRVLAVGQARGARLVYKKIDSTLRGPVAAELAAVAAALPGTQILFAPANPQVGRTVRGGQLLVHGVPVTETEFGRDPVSPVRESRIARLLGAAATAQVIIPDLATEGDLERAVRQIHDAGRPWIAVGSGALARAAGRYFPPGEAARPAMPPRPAGPTLLIGGSAHPANREQAHMLARTQGVPVHELSIAEPQQAIQSVIESLRAKGAAMLLVEKARADSKAVLEAIATAASAAIAATGAGRIFATGGETAYALCRALDVATLAFLAEIEPGLSLSCGEARGRPLLLAIKPGGFGDVHTWERAWMALQHGG